MKGASSLRVRLLAVAAASIFAALAFSWFAMTWLFQRHIDRRIVEELHYDALQLVADLGLDADGRPTIDTPPSDSRFVEAGGGLYWQLSTQSGVLRSDSLESQRLPSSPHAIKGEWSHRIAAGPFGQRVLLLERTVLLNRSAPPILVQLASNEAAATDAAEEFGRELAVWLLLLWLVLAGAAWIQVQLGLRPLERVRADLDTLRNNPTKRLDAPHPPEIEPLIQAINALADAREKDLRLARHRAADLAHALKTPLAALSAQTRRAREAGAIEAADGLDRAIASARATVEAELARARAVSIRQTAHGASTAVLAVIDRLIDVIERTDFGAERIFEVNVPAELQVPMETPDLAELLGAVMENAARFARQRVVIHGRATDAQVFLSIEDDGPGMGEFDVAEALSRGGRLDEAGPGHGIGLSIATELVEAAGGSLSIARSAIGGLNVTLAWTLSGSAALLQQ